MSNAAAPVIWRRGSFVGLFADPFVKDSELEGGWLAPSISDFTQALKVSRSRGGYGPGCITCSLRPVQRLSDGRVSFWSASDPQRADLARLAAKLEAAANLSVDSALSRHAPEDHIWGFMSRFSADVRALAPGDFLLRPGGWRRRNGGHVIIFVILRHAGDTFSLAVCNTGGGTQYHPASSAAYPKGSKVRAALNIPDIPLTRLTSPAFLYMLAKMELVRREENSAESLYEVLLPYLAGGPLRDATREPLAKHGQFESVQRAGTCFFRCILTATRYVLSCLCGWPQPSVKVMFVAVRLAYLGAAAEHMRCMLARGPEPFLVARGDGAGGEAADISTLRSRIGGCWDDAVLLPPTFTESDATLVSMACRQTATAVSKLVSSGVIGLPHVGAAEVAVGDTLGMLGSVARAAGLGHLVADSGSDTDALRPRVKAALQRALDDVQVMRSATHGVAADAAVVEELVRLTEHAPPVADADASLSPARSLAAASLESFSSSWPPALAWAPRDAIVSELTSCTYPGFELVARLGLADTKPFTGGASEGHSEVFADLVDPCYNSASPWSLRRIEAAVRKCIAQCDGMRSVGESAASSASGATASQAIALVEDLVHERIPFPALGTPLDLARGAARFFEWAPTPDDAPYSVDSQRSLAQALYHLARVYGDATTRVIGSRSLFGAKVVTLATFAVLIDATVRLTPTVGEPSALTLVLSGGSVAAGAGDNGPVAYGLTLVSNAGVAFQDLTAVLILGQASLCDTRAAILRYLRQVRRLVGCCCNRP